MRRLLCTLVTVLLVLAAGQALAPARVAALPLPSYTVRTMHIDVRVGPRGDQRCTIVADLYRPRVASPTRRVPAVLMTHGFGGSKDSDAAVAALFASNGYAVLAYSGLGFGGSTCNVTLDDPAYDGRAASQLIGFLGHQAFVVQDGPGDPRVGMWGTSYGGAVQLAAASLDHRLDAIIPIATWNDLRYSLLPNNADLARGVTSSTPGVAKTSWGALFGTYFATSLLSCISAKEHARSCASWYATLASRIAVSSVLGYPAQGVQDMLGSASVATYAPRVKAPTLLIQGQRDTLFNLNEAQATYQQLQAQGTPVQMIWTSGGHTGKPDPRDYDLSRPTVQQYPIARMLGWFGHYLKGEKAGAGPEFAYLRDWLLSTQGSRAAYGTSTSGPSAPTTTWHLSAKGALVSDPAQVRVGSQTLLTGIAGLSTSIGPLDLVEMLGQHDLYRDLNLPGTFAVWTAPASDQPVDVVGSPVLDVRLHAPLTALTGRLGPLGQLSAVAKMYDVAPDGSARLVNLQVAPFRVADPTRPVRIVMPAVVHRFAPGHRVRVMIAGGDMNMRGSALSVSATITTGDAGQALRLPVVRSTAASPAARASKSAPTPAMLSSTRP